MAVLLESELAVCGIDELDTHADREHTDVLSILDPQTPDPPHFSAWPTHARAIVRFHDEIAPSPNVVLPDRSHIETILNFGRALSEKDRRPRVLVHCHMGISRSTAALAILIAAENPAMDEDAVFAHLLRTRARSWPNSRMIGLADDALAREGRLTAALRRLYARQLAAFPQYADSLRAIGRSAEVEMALG